MTNFDKNFLILFNIICLDFLKFLLSFIIAKILVLILIINIHFILYIKRISLRILLILHFKFILFFVTNLNRIFSTLQMILKTTIKNIFFFIFYFYIFIHVKWNITVLNIFRVLRILIFFFSDFLFEYRFRL